ncbi:hypothetical protein Peur_073447 [Populus x canadensis]
MSSLSMRVFGYDLQLELIPANQRMIKHEDYEELAISVMSMVDLLVHKTSERIESATDILKAILKPIVDGEEEIHWLPRDPEALKLTESNILSKRSYANKGEEVLMAGQFLEPIIKVKPVSALDQVFLDHQKIYGEFLLRNTTQSLKKRIERTLIRTEGGSYQHSILIEHLKGIQSRAEEIVQVLQGKPW